MQQLAVRIRLIFSYIEFCPSGVVLPAVLQDDIQHLAHGLLLPVRQGVPAINHMLLFSSQMHRFAFDVKELGKCDSQSVAEQGDRRDRRLRLPGIKILDRIPGKPGLLGQRMHIQSALVHQLFQAFANINHLITTYR